MDNNLKQRQQKFQEFHKQISWRDFIKHMCSWHPLILQKIDQQISRYPATERIGPLVDNETFQTNRNEQTWIEVDQMSDFFWSLYQLQQQTPRAYRLIDFANENSDYSDNLYGAQNAYLSFAVWLDSSNILYSYQINVHCDTILNSVHVSQHSSSVYSSFTVQQSHNIFYSKGIYHSSDIWFSANMVWCQHCFLCEWLENKKYHIKNKAYSPEQYHEKKAAYLKNKEKYTNELIKSIPLRNKLTTNSQWTWLYQCDNITDGHIVSHTSHGHNIYLIDGSDHSSHLYNTFGVWLDCHHFYGVISAWHQMSHVYCSLDTGTSSDIYYCMNLQDCHHCLWCIGLINQSYCIFNKQYTKDERHKKVDKIFTHMETDGDLGKFFPPKMNPFYFNDTAAALIEDFTKEETIADWYLRRDDEINVDIPEWMEVVTIDQLSDYEWHNEEWQWTINPSVLKKVIKDKKGNAYRVIKMEYDFLVKHGLPLPRQHWLERLKGHFRVSK